MAIPGDRTLRPAGKWRYGRHAGEYNRTSQILKDPCKWKPWVCALEGKHKVNCNLRYVKNIIKPTMEDVSVAQSWQLHEVTYLKTKSCEWKGFVRFSGKLTKKKSWVAKKCMFLSFCVAWGMAATTSTPAAILGHTVTPNERSHVLEWWSRKTKNPHV